MNKKKFSDLIRIYLDRPLFRGWINLSKFSTFSCEDYSIENLKLQLQEECVRFISSDRIVDIRYSDILDLTYESKEDKAIVRIVLEDKEYEICYPIKETLYNFSGENSAIKERWGYYSGGEYKGCMTETSTDGESWVWISSRPVDVTTDGVVRELEEGEPWLGYLFQDNTRVIATEIKLTEKKRTLSLVYWTDKDILIREELLYTFANLKRYRVRSYYSINMGYFMRKMV